MKTQENKEQKEHKRKEGSEQAIEEIYQEKKPLTINFLTKDIDISKRDFVLLFLIETSLVYLLIGQISFDVIIGVVYGTDFGIWAYLLNGSIVGMAVSLYLIDRMEYPLKYVQYILISGFIISILEIVLFIMALNILLPILFFVNSLLIIVGMITYTKIFLIKTTILERGRILAILFVIIFILSLISLISIIFTPLIIFPFGFISVSIIFINSEKNYKVSVNKAEPILKRRSFTIPLIKYYLFFTVFSITAGLSTPLEISVTIFTETFGGNIAFIVIFIILLAIITILILGIIFDYFGRKSSLSYILLAIALSNYASVFTFRTEGIPTAVTFSAYIAAIMCIPLLIGDEINQERYGSALSISYFLLGAGVIIGLYFRMMIPELISEEYRTPYIIMGTVFMMCIVSFLFLSFMKETLPRKEQEWKHFLVHLYIIHESGILIYENAFREEKSDTPGDLISSGIVGLKAILEEIVKGEQQVKTIDHGDRKLLFMTNFTNHVIFTLVVKEELLVLRKKLESLVELFDKRYFEKTMDIGKTGIDMKDFREVSKIVRSIFGKLKKPS